MGGETGVFVLVMMTSGVELVCNGSGKGCVGLSGRTASLLILILGRGCLLRYRG